LTGFSSHAIFSFSQFHLRCVNDRWWHTGQ